ncbi:cytochrome c biogenesis protein CcdA [Kamptonema cortianum]|nr:cytochrome c biogenesis protein CcdA [Geitlerinema splendidum]MDK3158521.1 cytochrome c biogenesis protein CcdA [Kamptonema cortianum]
MTNLKVLLVLLFTGLMAFAFGQEEVSNSAVSGKVTWSIRLLNEDIRPGEHNQIIVEANIEPGWHVFGPQLQGEWVHIQTELLGEDNPFEPAGDPVFKDGTVKMVPGFNQDGMWYENVFAFAIPVKLKEGLTGSQTSLLKIRSQACDDLSCDRPRNAELALTFTVAGGEARPEFSAPILDDAPQPEGYVEPEKGQPSPNGGAASSDDINPYDTEVASARQRGLLAFLGISFVAGLLALLTPCVWPMIPITVSYFSKQTESGKKKNLVHALAYCFGIMTTFVGLGLAVTLIFGASGVQKLAASPIANGFLGILFVVLALNLFGVFEIFVPQGVINKAQAGTKRGGLIAPILLGFVFSLTTFTCTVPFVGTILVSATAGDIFYPILGMLAFSLAFAIPFFALAMVPQGLAKLPKSGTWLNAVKAYMGFLELAAAAKFFSNIDVVLNSPPWIPLEAFGAIWVAIFSAAAIYLFGWIRMPHDDGSKVGIGRKIFAAVNVGIVAWLLAGIGNPAILGQALAFFPPGKTHAGEITWIMDYEEGLAVAKANNQPVFVNFTGKTCGNCRVMENQRFPMPAYREQLDKFVRIELFTDRDTPEDNKNDALRTEMTKSATNPAYAILDPDGNVVLVYPGMARTDAEFVEFLKEGHRRASGS